MSEENLMILKLKDGMVLRLLPFNHINYYDINRCIFLPKINKIFIDEKILNYINFP